MNDRLTLWLKELHPIWFVLLLTSVSFVALVPFAILAAVFPSLSPGPGPLVAKQGFYEIAFGSVFFVPLLETALYQALPIELLSRKTSFSWQAKVVISAMLFGAGNCYGADCGPSQGDSCRRAFRPIGASKAATCNGRFTSKPVKLIRF